MAYDVVITNGMVIDGTGFSRYRADIGIRTALAESGTCMGRQPRDHRRRRTVRRSGHHRPAYALRCPALWDKLCTPSIWHGVTTVLAATVGYAGAAPA